MKNNVSEQICAGQEAFHIHHITKAGELITYNLIDCILNNKRMIFLKLFQPGGLSVVEVGEESADLSWNPEACSR